MRKKIVIAISVIVLLGAGALSTLWWFAKRQNGPIPRQYTKNLRYSLYYPTQLPQGFYVDQNSFQEQDNVLIFSIKAPNGKNIAVAQQPRPGDAPSHTKSNSPVGIPGEKDFTTAIGQGHVGLWEDKYVADITTNKGTWIILNTTGFTTSDATKVAQSFTEL
jgi:hypothetical protein